MDILELRNHKQPMSWRAKVIFFLLLPLSATAAEFSTTVTLPGERYASPNGGFFSSNDGGTELIAGTNPLFWRYHLGVDGIVERQSHPLPRGTSVTRFKLGDDVVEVMRYYFPFGSSSVARISS